MDRLFRIAYKFCVIFLGFTFFTAGMGKLYAGHSYFGFMGPVWLADKLAEYNLGLYGEFIGLSQVVIGVSLLSWRFRKIGSIMLIPMILNILMVTISLQWRGTPYVVAVFLLMNLFIVGYDSREYLHFVGLEPRYSGKILSYKGSAVWLVGLLLVIASIGLSYWHVVAAWILSLIGLATSIFSNRMERLNN